MESRAKAALLLEVKVAEESWAVFGAGSVLSQGCNMLRGAVAFVSREAGLGIDFIKVCHQSVSYCLGDYGGHGDGEGGTVTLNNRTVWMPDPLHWFAVNKQQGQQFLIIVLGLKQGQV